MNLIIVVASVLLIVALTAASGKSSKKNGKKKRSYSLDNRDRIIEILEKARELPPPYKIPIKAFNVEIDETPRPPIFPTADSSESLSDMGKENVDYYSIGVFDRYRIRILADLDACGHPDIADYSELYPESNTPIGIREIAPRYDTSSSSSTSSSYSSSSCSSFSSSSSSSSSSAAARRARERRRRRRAVSLGSYPDSKKANEKEEINQARDVLMNMQKNKEYGRSSERERKRAASKEQERAREQRELEEKEKRRRDKREEKQRKAASKKEKKEKKDRERIARNVSNESEEAIEIHGPIQEIKKKKDKKKSQSGSK